MKIVRIIARLNVGGPARHVALLNAGLQARGHQTLLAYGAVDTGEASLEAPAIESGIPLARQQHLVSRVRAGSDLRALVALIRLIFREQPDIVHTHTAKAGMLGRLAALAYNVTRPRARRALVVHTFHGHVFEGYFRPGISALVARAERWLAYATDIIVTISLRQQADITGRFSVARLDKTVVVPLGLELGYLFSMPVGAPDLRTTIGATPDDIVVGYAGRIVPVKELPTLLRAFARACAIVPALLLVLAGDGPERAAAEALAIELRIDHRVHFLGWVDDLRRFYSTVDVFALTSVNEGTPVAVIEAMAAGCAVVATSVGGVPDVVEAEVSGLLVPSRDAEALGAALVRLASAPELRATMGAAGRALAMARYSHLRLVDDIERLYVKGLVAKRA